MGLAQAIPVADMCNPGLPFYARLLPLVLGSAGLAASLLAFLFGYRMSFLEGFIASNFLILVGLALLILAGIRAPRARKEVSLSSS